MFTFGIIFVISATFQISNADDKYEEFKCHMDMDLPPYTPISAEEAEERKCCIDLPCKYKTGCWAGLMPPLYSAPRYQALTKEQAHHLEHTLIYPAVESGNLTKTFVSSMPNHGWWRVSVPKTTHNYFYEGIQKGFLETFGEELKVTNVNLDLFYVDDFDINWANDETYTSMYPGAAYWIHNDCMNFRICHEETGYKGSDFTGDGVAFILPAILPSDVDYRDGNDLMPAALELYNISDGHRDENGERMRPPNRQWASIHRYNLGEIIFFNAYRWHSGHVPRVSTYIPEMNLKAKRSETVGFAAKHKEGWWALFRMCKGSTDDKVRKKILETDANPTSTGESSAKITEDDIRIADKGLEYDISSSLKSDL
jgi:hypothetical protein